ncbi:MAG: hypothetical protein ACK55I_09240, partial [bacterium]
GRNEVGDVVIQYDLIEEVHQTVAGKVAHRVSRGKDRHVIVQYYLIEEVNDFILRSKVAAIERPYAWRHLREVAAESLCGRSREIVACARSHCHRGRAPGLYSVTVQQSDVIAVACYAAGIGHTHLSVGT